jgi:4-amino-4-deoxy-L-arabinose transferase-like glycosyltransferase
MKNFLKENRVAILLVLIVLLGTFLRLYQFEDMLRFNADQARDAQIVDKMFEEKEFPLLGPKAGGTSFKLGPASYYLEYLSAAVFGRDPAGMAFIVVILGILSIPFLFIFLKFYFSSHISLILTFLYAVSFYAIKYSRFAWNPNFIPFFMLAFLIAVLKIIEGRNPLFWNIAAGIIMGIGVQFHTLLIFLMPALFLSAHAYLLVKKKERRIGGVIFALALVLLLNLPAMIYDFQNEGENWRAFFAGAGKKTGSDSMFPGSVLKTGQFYIQGGFYVLTGYEPKNWLNIGKLISSRNSAEIAVAALASFFFAFGLFQIIRYFLKEKNSGGKNFLGLVIFSVFLSFIIFLPLADELNIRFFIALIFLPFVFLGVLMNYLSENFRKKLFYPAAILIVAALTFYNLNVYKKTYDPQIFSGKSSTYGGIALREAREISEFARSLSQNEEFGDSRFYFQPFEFIRSVDYFNKKAGFNVSKYDENKTDPGAIVFWVVKNKNAQKTIESREDYFSLADWRDIGRFTALAFRVKQ